MYSYFYEIDIWLLIPAQQEPRNQKNTTPRAHENLMYARTSRMYIYSYIRSIKSSRLLLTLQAAPPQIFAPEIKSAKSFIHELISSDVQRKLHANSNKIIYTLYTERNGLLEPKRNSFRNNLLDAKWLSQWIKHFILISKSFRFDMIIL